jgi:hypothetical protein
LFFEIGDFTLNPELAHSGFDGPFHFADQLSYGKRFAFFLRDIGEWIHWRSIQQRGGFGEYGVGAIIKNAWR